MLKSILLTVCLIGTALGQWDPNFSEGKYGIVHLFEWHWDTIADECETMLDAYKIGGVQISPPTENRVVYEDGVGRPWWERYQPVAYDFSTRSGDRDALSDMIDRCNAVGIRIYADMVINHMCGEGGSGTGTGGSSFDADALNFPEVPYSSSNFNPDCTVNNYQDADNVRNCRLVGLLDLDQGQDYVRGKMIDLMNDLISLGVAGFRVDACKHMWPGDLGVIFGGLNDLRSDIFGSGKRAYVYQEVIDNGGEAVTAQEYVGIGSVTEFKYGDSLGNNRNSLQYLSNFGEEWGMLDGYDALVFLNNHDNQRGHGGGGNIITFEEPYDLKILSAYMLAWPYGVPRVMSSYYFTNDDQGPPDQQRVVESDGSCGNGWVCEHRWRPIRNMFAFSVAVEGTGMENWWTNDNNQIAFSRGTKGFFAANKAGYDMDENLFTGLPDGSYCNVIDGDFYDGVCAGECVTVSGGYADIVIPSSPNPMLAIHVDAMTTECNVGGGTGDGQNSGVVPETSCVDCTCADSEKVDCGELATTEESCTESGCLWCPLNTRDNVPWCFYQASTSTTAPGGNTGGNSGGSGGSSGGTCKDCTCMDRADCGELASTEESCTASGCLWCPLEDGSTQPWCFYPTGNAATTQPVSGSTTPRNEVITTSTTSGDACVDCDCPSHRKSDCGYMGIDENGCVLKGCLWCENPSNSADPWCFVPDSTGDGDSGTAMCYVDDSAKADCGYSGMDESECDLDGCCWAESNVPGVPYCYHQVSG